MEHCAAVKYAEILAGYDWVSAAPGGENKAYVSRTTGVVHWMSGETELDDGLPDDIEDESVYLALPHQHDLGLASSLALSFAEEHLGDAVQTVYGFFHKRGAYREFKNLLERKGLLQAWYDHEASRTEAALRAWCAEQAIEIMG